ncbi:MAG: DUF2851 family protein [Bacteroidota bacterium]
MQESFLHFLWRFQYFDKQDLRTKGNEPVQVLRTGSPHTHAGPDFCQARVLIANVEWAGNVEIHLRSSDWDAHAHQHNAAYDNVILHVVWQDDRPIRRKDGTAIPTLELQNRTDTRLLSNYQALLHNQEVIPCASQFVQVSTLEKFSMLDKVLMQRLQQKAQLVESLWQASRHDWEETTYQLLAQNFGFKLNSEPFLRLSQSVPLKLLHKHRDNLLQLEAMLFGQAGLLDADNTEAYAVTLRREHTFLHHKYQLGSPLANHEWKFLRLRPANFPTVRLAQLARLIAGEPSLFTLLTQSESVKELSEKLQVQQSAYWQEHYVWGKQANGKVPGLGKSAIENIIINSAVPLLTCYAQQYGNSGYLDRAVAWLEQLPPEHNHVTRTWQTLGLKVKTAFDSQASIELYNHFCAPKQCLHCNVGVSLLKVK